MFRMIAIMKRCCNCRQEKPSDEYHKCSGRPDGLQNECKSCRSVRHKNTWGPERQAAQLKSNTARREERLTKIAELKSVPCMDCGGKFLPCAMDFDHRPGETKISGVAELVQAQVAWSVIEAEIVKCDIVCSNCHRVRTWQRNHGSMTELAQGARLQNALFGFESRFSLDTVSHCML